MDAYYALMAVTVFLFGITFCWWGRDGWLLLLSRFPARFVLFFYMRTPGTGAQIRGHGYAGTGHSL